MKELPWRPLYTILRSGKPELTIYGIVSVTDRNGRQLASAGDSSAFIWSRSLLKPWQLLGHLDTIKKHYPDLNSAHLAMMLSSQSSESFHINCLNEIMNAGGVDESVLKCPASYPMDERSKCRLVASGEGQKPLYNGCSGKHLGYVLAMKAKGENYDGYLSPEGKQFQKTKEMLAWMLDRSSPDFEYAIDGCLLPNYGFAAREIAWMYAQLCAPPDVLNHESPPQSISTCLDNWQELSKLMKEHPDYVGGSTRLDTRIMKGSLFSPPVYAIAKEGADGLLAAGLPESPDYPDGLGILVKISSGYNPLHLETIIREVACQLGLSPVEAEAKSAAHLQTEFHFDLKGARKKIKS